MGAIQLDNYVSVSKMSMYQLTAIVFSNAIHTYIFSFLNQLQKLLNPASPNACPKRTRKIHNRYSIDTGSSRESLLLEPAEMFFFVLLCRIQPSRSYLRVSFGLSFFMYCNFVIIALIITNTIPR